VAQPTPIRQKTHTIHDIHQAEKLQPEQISREPWRIRHLRRWTSHMGARVPVVTRRETHTIHDMHQAGRLQPEQISRELSCISHMRSQTTTRGTQFQGKRVPMATRPR